MDGGSRLQKLSSLAKITEMLNAIWALDLPVAGGEGRTDCEEEEVEPPGLAEKEQGGVLGALPCSTWVREAKDNHLEHLLGCKKMEGVNGQGLCPQLWC